jgi:hypothetical protein
LPDAQFCHACGQSLIPSAPVAAPMAPPPPPPVSALPAPSAAPFAPRFAPPPPPPQFVAPAPQYAVPPTPAQLAAPQWPIPGPASMGGIPAGSAPTGWPAAGWNAVATPGLVAARPFGILVLTVFEIIVALVGFTVVLDYFYWADWRFGYEDFGWGMVDGAFGLAFLVASVAGFVVASKLWSLRPDGWSLAIMLSCSLMSLQVVSALLWEMTTLSLIGLCVHAGILVYLNLAHVRALFGRAPQTFIQRTSS